MRVSPRVIDTGFKALNSFHRTLLRVSGARIGTSAFGMTMIELHTVGRASGREHTVVLGAPVREDATFVLVASKGGDDRDPDWFRNLLAHPQVDVTIAGERRRVRARVASPREEDELWPRVIATYGPYAAYRRRTRRHIPLIICEPR